MKQALTTVLLLSSLCLQAQKDSANYVIKRDNNPSETIDLTKGKQYKNQSVDTGLSLHSQCQISYYDGTRFNVVSKSGNLYIYENKANDQRFQNSLHMPAHHIQAAGYASNAEIKLYPKKPDFQWYLVKIGINRNQLEAVSGPISIRVTGVCKDSTLFPVLRMDVHGSNAELYVLPHTTRVEARFRRKHKPNEQAIFSKFTITDAAGNVYEFGPGDYWLTEGKSISFGN